VSPVLTAMGVEPEIAVGAIRFSLGRTTIEDDLEYAIAQLKTHLPQA
jgi:cysteine desulfurase